MRHTIHTTIVRFACLAFLASGCAGESGIENQVGPEGSTLTGPTVAIMGLEWVAHVNVMESFPVQLVGGLTIRNSGDGPISLLFPDGCVALLRARESDGAGETPVWDQRQEVACTLATVPVDLETGEERSFDTPTVSAREILGADLPDGEYRIAVYARPVGEEVEVEVGTVELAVPRP